jgi:hypothetical protein
VDGHLDGPLVVTIHKLQDFLVNEADAESCEPFVQAQPYARWQFERSCGLSGARKTTDKIET